VPLALVLLLGAALVSGAWPGSGAPIPVATAEPVAVGALVLILLGGGMDIGAARLRAAAADVGLLAVPGTFATAGAMTVAAHLVVGLDWKTAGVLGAALAPTDPAVVFSVLGGSARGRARTVLEGEAGVNDPAGIALLIGVLEVATHPDASVLVVLREFVVQMGLGAAAGAAGGWALVVLMRRLAGSPRSATLVLLLTGAGLLYGAVALVGGSGFLAVFVAGLALGDAATPDQREAEEDVSRLSSVAEVVVFVALGLTIPLFAIHGSDWLAGVALALLLGALVRPVVVAACLARSRLDRRERAFVTLGGLKGAVPILLAALAVLGNAPDAARLYDLVFVVVLVSVGAQGSLVAPAARRLGLG
jgi:cell volume regulation protein A